MLRANRLEDTCSRIIHFANKQLLKDGLCIHSPILKMGVHDNMLLTNNLLSLYAKCCGSQHARQLFDEMPHRDVVSWTAVLSAYVKDVNHEEALRFFNSMKISGEKPNEFTFSNVLRSCCALGDSVNGGRVHASAIKHGFGSNTILCSSLIELYSKSDMLEDAVHVFNDVPDADTLSWTAMISSFVQAGDWARAARYYIRMIEKPVPPNEYTFVKLLFACASMGVDHVKLIHAQLILLGARLNLVLKTALVDVYARSGNMEDALKVLIQTSEQDEQLWISVIQGFSQNTNFVDDVGSFRLIAGNNIIPKSYCYAGILNACSSAGALDLGMQIHKQVIMAGLESDVFVGNALLDFYTKCSNGFEDVKQVFEVIALPNLTSWTTLIAGLAANGLKDECFRASLQMRSEGHQPNCHTLSNILEATESAKETMKFHGFIMKSNADRDMVVVNALVDAYAGLDMADCALRLVKGMSYRNVATYTILASKLNQIGRHEMSLEIINHIRDDDLEIDGFAISTFLSASAILKAVRIGEQLHCYSIASGFNRWISVSNGLIDFYGKCGRTIEAQGAFSEVCRPNTISWNCLMHGFALNGDKVSALSTLEDMRLSGTKPDSVTLMMVLNVCSKAGLVDMALEYFHSLRQIYDIKPQFNHYALLLDLLGREGRLREAVGMLKSIPFRPNALLYKKLLHACKLHRNMLLAEELASKGLKLNPCDLEFYALLATIYDEAGRSDLGDKMRCLLKERGLRKP